MAIFKSLLSGVSLSQAVHLILWPHPSKREVGVQDLWLQSLTQGNSSCFFVYSVQFL